MGGEDGNIVIWSKIQGMKLGNLSGHKSCVNSVISNPRDSKIILSASDDFTIQIWNLLVN